MTKSYCNSILENGEKNVYKILLSLLLSTIKSRIGLLEIKTYSNLGEFFENSPTLLSTVQATEENEKLVPRCFIGSRHIV